MKIQCLGLRAGGTKVDIDGVEYHFEPLEDGAHVADIANEAHIDRFLSISDHYKVYHGKLEPVGKPAEVKAAKRKAVAVDADQPVAGLLGSTVHEPSYEIGDKVYSLHDVVAIAFKNSGLEIDGWNSLEDADRHAKIDIVLDDLADAAEAEPASGDERAELVEAYKAKFGKAPHHRASLDTIKAALAE